VEQLAPQIRELYKLACDVSPRAYAPYSNFQVGAAVLTKRQNIYCGINVENASYGLTCCAERNAIFSAVAAEGADVRVTMLAVYVEGQVASPCGACRQVIAEFGKNVHIVFSAVTKVVDSSLEELLPSHFVAPNRFQGPRWLAELRL
jgi:cytidine deaminase